LGSAPPYCRPSSTCSRANDRAVDAYEVGAVDYLLKPLRSERLAASLDRIIASRAGATAESLHDEPDDEDSEVIPIELAGTTKLVPRSAVRYCRTL
jgi:DNA-binding LytR/AlgR family response regulator